MLLDFGSASLIGKVMQQPQRAKEVLQKIDKDGIVQTVAAVNSKLDEPIPMGYSNVGIVDSVGAGVQHLKPGDRVVSNGAHAEIVVVPKHLVSKVPDGVSDDQAVFTVVGAIALQGVRLAKVSLGEKVAVIGLGLIGQLTVQILKASGCSVLGIDFDPAKLQLAQELGATVVDNKDGSDAFDQAMAFTGQNGMDAVVVTTATQDSSPMMSATRISRQRGRIILVGTAGLNFSRDEMYKKELSFQVSCSYGPGRYDPSYEFDGVDYPFGLVRWTENRNFEAVLQLMSERRLRTDELNTHEYGFEQAREAYQLLQQPKSGAIGILLRYTGQVESTDRITITDDDHGAIVTDPQVSFIGAGGYATKVLIPAFKKAGAHLDTISSKGGVSASRVAKKFGFNAVTTNPDKNMPDTSSIVVIATRHDSHADLVCKALKAGKHVFVEKPLCVTEEELASIEEAIQKQSEKTILMVGFNRRFSGFADRMKTLLSNFNEPKSFIYKINAGFLPQTHWSRNQVVGGGRIVGEVCHFVDLLRFLTGSKIEHMQASQTSGGRDISCSINLGFECGSQGTIHYFANGHPSLPKESLEIYSEGKVLLLDNFRRLTGHGFSNFKKAKTFAQDKGQHQCAQQFMKSILNGAPSPIPISEIIEVSRRTIQISNSLK